MKSSSARRPVGRSLGPECRCARACRRVGPAQKRALSLLSELGLPLQEQHWFAGAAVPGGIVSGGAATSEESRAQVATAAAALEALAAQVCGPPDWRASGDGADCEAWDAISAGDYFRTTWAHQQPAVERELGLFVRSVLAAEPDEARASARAGPARSPHACLAIPSSTGA